MKVVVAHVMRTYGVHGGEHQLAQLFRTFKDSSFQHIFVSIYQDDSCKSYFSDIPKLRIETLLSLRMRVFPSLFKEMLMLLLILPVLQLRLFFVLQKYSCRICVVHGFQGALVAWLPAILLQKVRFVYIHRGTKAKSSLSRLSHWLYRPFEVVAGVSRSSAKSLESFVTHVSPVAIENGIDSEAIELSLAKCRRRSESTNLTVVCVGRLIQSKGQALIINAFARLVDHFPLAKLLIVGDGPDAGALKELARQLNLDKAVTFTGNRNDIPCLLGQSDIFVHASESEGLSNAVLEAMAIGLPSVVMTAPGVTECHLNAVTGLVVERRIEDLGDGLLRLAHDPDLRAQMARAAKSHVLEHYSMDANSKRYAALYRQLA